MSLNHLRIGQRLALAFGLVLALVAVMTGLAWWRLEATQIELVHSAQLHGRARAAADWQTLTQLNVTRTMALAKAGGGAEITAYLSPQIKQTSQQISTTQKALEAGVNDARGRELMAAIADQRLRYLDLRNAAFQQLHAQDAQAMATIEQRLLPASRDYLAALEAFRSQQQQLADNSERDTADAVNRAQAWLAVLGAACLALGAAAAWLITRSVTRPLGLAVGATRRIAGGDLSLPVPVTGRDELGTLLTGLSDMQEALRSLVGQVHASVDSIRTASGEVADGSLDLSGRTEETASTLQQTASSMEQISVTVHHTADSARDAIEVAVAATQAANQGGEVVAQVVHAMDDITQQSSRIGEITSLIESIAFQTNILALNAAVEAARAGEHGRGFAVVAGEVRSLARRAAEAAHDIKALIGHSVDTVDKGARLAHQAGAVMGQIVDAVRRVDGLIGTICNATNEQAQGIGQVSIAVGQIDQMTQQNAALVEESAAAAASLQDQAGRLAGLMDRFRLGSHAMAA